MNRFALLVFILTTGFAQAASDNPKVTYKQGKEVDFEALLIQGALDRPEMSVVTGQTDQGADGLVRLRKNFLDRLAVEQGEEP